MPKPGNIRKTDYPPPVQLDGLIISMILEEPRVAQKIMGDKKDDFKKITGQVTQGLQPTA